MILAKLAIELVQILVYGTFVIFFTIKIIAHFTTDAPHIDIPDHAIEPILNALDLKDNSILYDLGSGSGKILIASANRNLNARAVGVEVDLFAYFISKLYTINEKRIKIIRDDFFDIKPLDATHVFMYLSPIVTDLFKHLKHYAKPGTKVVSCDFEIEGQTPIETIDISVPGQRRGRKLYVYTI